MHMGGPNQTQNQGNSLGDRPCVRQSKNFRSGMGGNTMKELMGQEQLKWNLHQTEGAYAGGRAHDALAEVPQNMAPASASPAGGAKQQQHHQQQQQEYQAPPMQQQQQQAYYPQQQQQQNYPQQHSPQYQQSQQFQAPQQQQQQQQAQAPQQQQQQNSNHNPITHAKGHRPGAGQANRQTFNLFTGE